ncbi:MAG TPA: Xaa-Pro aminopeptidase [Gemmatimonadaceae bacterium]|jgi:Xaa-Pro aminopeptidase
MTHRLLRFLPLLAIATATAGAQISEREFAARRDSLAKRIDSGVVIAFGGRTLVADFGTFFQLPAFHYLTNFDEPDAAFVMVARKGVSKSTLFITPSDPRRAFYYGWRPDSASAKKDHNIDGRSFSALSAVVDSLAGTGLPIYTLDDFEDADFAVADSLTRGKVFVRTLAAKYPSLVVKNAHPIVDQLRARKSAAEIALLKKAAEISSQGHRAVLLSPEPQHEYELQAVLESNFIRLGASRPAYGSIVGSGINGTQLHYMKDRGVTKPGDVVVMDAAAEYEGYAADITRTIPVSGTFTAEQKQIYQIVRDAQAAAERNSKPGTLASVASDSAYVVRAKGLASLGLVESQDAQLDPPWPANCQRQPTQCTQAYFWMIHGISHGLGLAVHDPMQSSYGDRTYKPGDVFTIEPGIYISTRALDALPDTPKNRAFIAKVKAKVAKYENTGVRIEDDYVITETGLDRISSAPREIAEIEALMKKRPRVVVP